MPINPLHAMVAAAGVALAACAHSAPATKDAVMTSAPTTSNLAPVKEWPLRFDSHSFSAWCYDTLECKVLYAGLEHGDDKPSPPSSTYGPGYLDHWSGTHGMIRNFPPPAKVSWRSKDGAAREAEIDIGGLFKDELIRHNVSREAMSDLPNGKYHFEPAILLEVNDRIIRIYMRSTIPTKDFQIPGNKYSDFRDDLILVEAYTY